MKKIISKYPVLSTIMIICLIFAIATSFDYSMFELFAYHSKPVVFWQYFSGAFMHGIKEMPTWFIWFHFLMNCLLLIPFGMLLESKQGSKKTLIIFIFTLIISSIVFHISTCNLDVLATGISAAGYAFLTGGSFEVKKEWKSYSKFKRSLLITIYLLALITILPTTLGMVSFYMHSSGIICYLVIHLVFKNEELK